MHDHDKSHQIQCRPVRVWVCLGLDQTGPDRAGHDCSPELTCCAFLLLGSETLCTPAPAAHTAVQMCSFVGFLRRLTGNYISFYLSREVYLNAETQIFVTL